MTSVMTVMTMARDRAREALLGLAAGDAVGTAVEFASPGSFPPVTDMVGGGPQGVCALLGWRGANGHRGGLLACVARREAG